MCSTPDRRSPSSVAPGPGIYDQLETAVDTIFVGRDGGYKSPLPADVRNYLVEPVAARPASGWEEGSGREPRRRDPPAGSSCRGRSSRAMRELNAWLPSTAASPGRRRPHPELRDRHHRGTSSEEERPSLVPYAGPFDGFHAVAGLGLEDLLSSGSTMNRLLGRCPAVGRSVEIPCLCRPRRVSGRLRARVVGATPAPSGGNKADLRPAALSCRCLARKPGAAAQRRPPSRTGTCRSRCGVFSANSAVCRMGTPDGRHPRRCADRRAGCR